MSAPVKLQVDWEAHLEALPLATWIAHCDFEPSMSQHQYLWSCGPVFANRACREILGISAAPPEDVTVYVHPEDRQVCLEAWLDFMEGKTARFHQTLRWIRPDTKETVSLSVRAQKLLCGDIQGWLRSAAAEAALSRLEELIHDRL
jgi:PAS domain-containing protein